MKWSLLILATALLVACDRPAEPLTQEAYVWQRQWTPELVDAIESTTAVSALYPLALEVLHADGDFATTEMHGFAPNHRCRGPVVRLFESCGATGWDDDACERVTALCRDALKRFGRITTELQIDYDCPTSKLDEFARLLSALRAAFPEVVLSFTALPTWLDSPDFASLAQQAEYYVLQVHSVILQGPDEPPILCDPVAARSAVRRAGALDHPFKVALPTHTHGVVFRESDGAVLDVFSEDLPQEKVAGIVRLASADPSELATLVREWNAERPAAMSGLIWFRLPLSTDRMNWPRSTWEIVMRGEDPISKWTVELEPEPSGFSTILLRNDGQRPEAVPHQIHAASDEPIQAGDGSNGYRYQPGEWGLGVNYTLQPRDWRDDLPIPPGAARPIGWIRSRGPVNWSISAR